MVNIIAEIGVNWNGDFKKALDMINLSYLSKADSVKFQMFNEKVIDNSPPQYKKALSKMILDSVLLKSFYDYSKTLNLKFIVSTMYPEAFNVINSSGIKPDYIKIRYSDRNNSEIAERACDYCTTNKVPIIISTNIVDDKIDISEIYLDCEELVYCLMYCISKYPPKYDEVDLSISNLSEFSGYSNHVANKFMPIIAMVRGIQLIEIHVMSNIMDIDHMVSLTFNELKDICEFRDLMIKLKLLE